MTANDLLLVIFGMVTGGCFGYVTAWRFARKLEHHDVVLAEWDQPIDYAAPPKGDLREFASGGRR